MKPRLHVITFGTAEKPSVRHRFVAARAWIEPYFDVTWTPHYDDPRNAAALAELGPGDVLMVQKRIPSLVWTLWRLRGLKAGVAYDFDDAVWTSPQGDSPVRRWRTRSRLRAILRRADVVMAANGYLADWARCVGADPLVIPMTIEVPGDRPPPRADGPVLFGWGGHPQSHYLLQSIAAPLGAFFAGRHDRRFVVMSGKRPDLNFDFDWWPFDAAAEERFFSEIDVGLAPATDSPFVRGKSPIKILQHFAHGRPVISNGTGATLELVSEATGWRVAGEGGAGWAAALEAAAADPVTRLTKGAAGRALVEARHAPASVFGRMVDALRALSARSAARGG